MAVSLRAATGDDAARLADLAARTFVLACPPHTTQADIDRHVSMRLSPAAFRQDLADPQITMLVAEDDDAEAVGYAMLVAGVAPPDGPGGERPAELRRIYVAEQHHGTAVASLLMGRALATARSTGHDVVWLGTNQLNERAIRFYRKHGFTITGEKQFRVGDAVENDYVLRCELTAQRSAQ